MTNNRIFIGNISSRTTKKDLFNNFEEFGEILRCDLKDKFAFIDYDSSKNCQDAIDRMHRTDLLGRQIIVEMSHGNKQRSDGFRGGYRDEYRRNDHDDRRDRDRHHDDRRSRHYDDRRDRDRHYDDRRSRHYDDRRDRDRHYDDRRERSRHYDDRRERHYDRKSHYESDSRNFKVKTSNLTSRVSWQDLKDFARDNIGPSVARTNVWSTRSGNFGVIELTDRGDYDYALKQLQNKEIDGQKVEFSEFTREDEDERRNEGDRHPRRGISRSARMSESKSSGRSRSRSESSKRSNDRSDRRSFPSEAEEKSEDNKSGNENDNSENENNDKNKNGQIENNDQIENGEKKNENGEKRSRSKSEENENVKKLKESNEE
ncbi:mRNA-binding protein [Bonamia ostreae]|uniref:mRNA-binding protein n=1 Tax=Bonamia ostreae TaxID=126728 RepID=A0ABV2AI96_9EUKA